MSSTSPQAGERVNIQQMSLRNGGWIGYSDDAVFVDDQERIKIRSNNISTIGLRVIEWDVAVMSILLVILGGYVVITRNPLIGIAFALAGVFSLYRTYMKRYQLVIQVKDKAKPVTVHPAHPEECHKTLSDAFDMEPVQRNN